MFKNCKKKRKNLNRAWIDYQKEFYSVPRNWIEKSIELIEIKNKIVTLFKLLTEK